MSDLYVKIKLGKLQKDSIICPPHCEFLKVIYSDAIKCSLFTTVLKHEFIDSSYEFYRCPNCLQAEL